MIKPSVLQNITQAKFTDTELLPEHGRGVICGAMTSNVIVTGSSDHGLRVWKTPTLEYSKELFSKKYGHKEWVTSVKILSDGRIVSAGMDGIVCLWDKSGVRCDTLIGHQASISKLQVDHSDLVISSSYDCTLRVWPLRSKYERGAKSQGDILAGPHKNAVLDFIFNNSLIVSGDKDGVMSFWDLNSGISVFKSKGHSQGVGLLSFFDNQTDRLVCSGGLKDGIVNLWDINMPKAIFSKKLHGGSVNVLEQVGHYKVICCSADKGVSVIDIRSFDKPLKQETLSSGILCGKVAKELLLAGLVDGNFTVINLDSLKPLYGFGAMKQGGLNLIEVLPDASKVLLAGDSPVSLVLDFNI